VDPSSARSTPRIAGRAPRPGPELFFLVGLCLYGRVVGGWWLVGKRREKATERERVSAWRAVASMGDVGARVIA
jgi:hypothetical protein